MALVSVAWDSVDGAVGAVASGLVPVEVAAALSVAPDTVGVLRVVFAITGVAAATATAKAWSACLGASACAAA